MSPAGSALLGLWPYVAAFLIGYLVPSRRSQLERIGVGVVLMLGAVVVTGLWPSDVPLREQAESAPEEWRHLLNVIVFTPLLGAAAILFLPRQAPKLLRTVTLVVLAVDFVASLYLLRVPMTVGWHFQYIADWVPAFGIRYHVAVDGISLWLVLLTTLTTPIAAYVSFGSIRRRTKELCFALLMLQGAMLGGFVALDLFLFYVFWELLLIPMFIIIGIWGGQEKIKASYKFFLYTMAGSVLMLAAILYLVWWHNELAGYPTFDYLALSRIVLPQNVAVLCFAAFAIAFIVKVPMWPLHTWLPDAHVQAPTGGSIILAAVLLKLGTYGYLRFAMGMFGGAAWESGANLAGVAVGLGIIYGALVAWKQGDVKRLVAYSSVAHMGFAMLGLFAATQAGIEGSIMTMINHGIATGALFLLVGVIYDRRHTRDVREFGGLAKAMPTYAVIFVVITMASIGVPGTNGFVGEFMVITGTYVSQSLGGFAKMQATLAALGVILAAVYMLSLVQRMFFGPLANAKNAKLKDLTTRETLALAPLVVLVFVIGMFPNLLLDRMRPTVRAALDDFEAGWKAHQSMPEHGFEARLRERRGGPLDVGYPEKPEPKPAETEEQARVDSESAAGGEK